MMVNKAYFTFQTFGRAEVEVLRLTRPDQTKPNCVSIVTECGNSVSSQNELLVIAESIYKGRLCSGTILWVITEVSPL